jgi:hypothetical protein
VSAPLWDEAAAVEAMARSIGDADDDWPYRTYRTTEDVGRKPHTLARAALTALAPLLAARDAAAWRAGVEAALQAVGRAMNGGPVGAGDGETYIVCPPDLAAVRRALTPPQPGDGA